MVTSDKFSSELNSLLEFIEEKLVQDYPIAVVNLEYFVLGIFDQKESNIYKIFYDSMLSNALDALHEAYYHLVSQKALSALRPNREIKYDAKFQEALTKADEEREKLGGEKITSEHVFLAIMADTSEDNKIRKVFEKAAVNYNILVEKIKTKKQIEELHNKPDAKDNDKTSPRQSFKPTIIGVSSPNDILSVIGWFNGKAVQGQNTNNTGTAIKAYCVNLNSLVNEGKIDKIVGREKEIDSILRVLGKRKKCNVMLVGDGGVGKTAIVEGLAYLVENGSVPPILYGRQILSLNMTALVAGTRLRGQFEERVQDLLDEISKNPQYILVIDNIETALGTKNGQEEFGLAAMLSHALDNGDIQVIGTTDFKGYRNTFDKDQSLARKFQKVVIEAPTKEDTLNILENIKAYYEDFHRVVYDESAIKSCIDLSDKYITERKLPDSAIDIMDEVGSSLSPNNQKSEKIEGIITKLKDLDRKIAETPVEDTKTTNELKDEMADAKNELDEAIKEYDKNIAPRVIDSNDISQLISIKTGIPINRLNTDDKARISTMADRIKQEVIGQDEAVDAVCRALKRNRVGLKNGRTYGSFLFLGGTGRGKSLLAKKIAKELFGDEKDLLRFDMSEYMDKTSVNKLIGANPGYVGYDQGGLITEQVKNKKHCVILLDEIEKADPEIYNLFLQVFDEGFLTDNTGQKIDFKNTVIILTSNAGAKSASEFSKGIGFGEDENENAKRILTKKLKNRFPPEFLNRLDDIIYFNKLTDENMKEIVKLEMNKLGDRVRTIGYELQYDDSAIQHILTHIKDESEYGARPVIRAIEHEYEDVITDLLLSNEYETKHVFNVSCLSDNTVSIA